MTFGCLHLNQKTNENISVLCFMFIKRPSTKSSKSTKRYQISQFFYKRYLVLLMCIHILPCGRPGQTTGIDRKKQKEGVGGLRQKMGQKVEKKSLLSKTGEKTQKKPRHALFIFKAKIVNSQKCNWPGDPLSRAPHRTCLSHYSSPRVL